MRLEIISIAKKVKILRNASLKKLIEFYANAREIAKINCSS